MKAKKLVAIITTMVLVITMGVCMTSCGNNGGKGEAEVIELRIGSGHSETGMPYNVAANDFFVKEVEKRVAERTDYEIKWITAWSGSVAKLAEVGDAVGAGLLDVGAVCSAFNSNMILQNLTYNVPFNSPDLVTVNKIMEQLSEEYPEDFNKVFDDMNSICLGIGGVGCYQLITTMPVDEISDLKNVGVAAAGPNLPMLKGTGAVPIQGDLTEAYTSFQTGVYDGWVMYPASSDGYKLYEVAPYQTNLDLGAVSCGYITVNKDKFNELPKEVQEIFIEVGREYTVESGVIANEMDEKGLQHMVDNGLTVVEMKPGEKEKYAELIPNMAKSWVEDANKAGYNGTEIMKRYIELLKETGYELPRDWSEEL